MRTSPAAVAGSPVTYGAPNARTAAVRDLVVGDPEPADDAAGLLRRVCRVAAREMRVAGAGVSLMTATGVRGISAASDPDAERVEDLQFLLGEGPCIEAFEARRPVLVADLARDAGTRWPAYSPAAYADGVRAVFAFPLQVGGARLGVLDMFRGHVGPLGHAELSAAFTFADVAVEMLLNGHGSAGERAGVEGFLDVGNRAQLFQAQGMVMVQLGVPVGEALARMRAHAYAEGRGLDDVARDVVERRLRFDRDGQ